MMPKATKKTRTPHLGTHWAPIKRQKNGERKKKKTKYTQPPEKDIYYKSE